MMNDANNEERNRIADQALKARTFSEIATATREMIQWVEDYPDDLGILDAYEVLVNMQEIAEFQQQEELRHRPLAVAVA